MPESVTDTEATSAYDKAVALIIKAQSVGDLYEVAKANADRFHKLTQSEQDSLREVFREHRSNVQHMIKAEAIDGQVLTIIRAEYRRTQYGQTFLLSGTWHRADGDAPFQMWKPGGENSPTMRFFSDRLPRDYPVQVVFTKDPHPTDPTKTMWNVQEVAPSSADRSEIPF